MGRKLECHTGDNEKKRGLLLRRISGISARRLFYYKNRKAMKTHILTKIKAVMAAAAILACAAGLSAQNSLPAPGSGGGFQPNTGGGFGGGFGGPGPAWNPGPPPPTYWGSPWYTGWNSSPSIVISPSVSTGNFTNQGITKVIANGYDATGVWRVLPMVVSYQYDGVQYDVTVLNAWNPWTDQWDRGLDIQAFNTNYILRNVTYDFYAVLSFGTFYFNL